MRLALDTNVLSALWGRESSVGSLLQQLNEARRAGSLVLCGAVFAESLAHPQATEPFLREFLERTAISVDFDLGEDVWVEAGRRYVVYAGRRRSSSGEFPRRLLTDFLIGSHALLRADRLLTLDQERYRRDFPELGLL